LTAGKVEGTLARYADQQSACLSTSEQEQVQQIFIQLVRPGEGTEDTRRLAKAELGEECWALVNQLDNSRLVVTSQDAAKQETVEVVHEAGDCGLKPELVGMVRFGLDFGWRSDRRSFVVVWRGIVAVQSVVLHLSR